MKNILFMMYIYIVISFNDTPTPQALYLIGHIVFNIYVILSILLQTILYDYNTDKYTIY